MNNFKKIVVAVSASLVTCGTTLVAHAQTTSYNPSWYVLPSINALDPDSRFGVNKNDVGGALRFGKPISEYWDIQTGLSYARPTEDNRKYEQYTLGVNALYMFSRQTIRPFILVGAGYEHDKVSSPLLNAQRYSPFLSAGAGFQVAMNDRWAVQADYRRVYGFLRGNTFGFDRSKNDYVTVGLSYAFDKPYNSSAPASSSPEPTRAAYVPPPSPVVAPTPAPAYVPPAPPRFEKYTLSSTELFSFDSAELSMPQPKLDELANALRTNVGVKNVMITGYADRLGASAYNQRLSERRATSVKNYLIRVGVDGSRLSADGKGEANPVVMCKEKNRAALILCLEPNRRVEVEQVTIERRVQ